jgi:hypothetical protein
LRRSTLENKMEKTDKFNLQKRYLIWLYKVTKEAFDRIERKFTQLEIDNLLLEEIKKEKLSKKAGRFIAEFQAYIDKKEKEGLQLKYDGKDLRPEFIFLELKLAAVEKAILKLLGKPGLEEIKSLYEKEMTERILKSTEH